jgi:hypothetical protein
MPLIRQVIPAFYGGVSQQAPSVRAPSQVEDAINVAFTIVDGASKRPPLELFNILSADDLREAFFHWVPSASGEWFLVVLRGDGLVKVHRLSDGAPLVGTPPVNVSYFQCTGPARQAFRAFTVGTDTYIVNRQVEVTLDPGVAAGTIAGTAQTLQDTLLDNAAEGSVWMILGDEVNQFDTYFAKKVNGKWIEWVQPGVQTTIEKLKMPHVIRITADPVNPLGWRWDGLQVEWGRRLVGNDKSNKWPSFVGNKINGISFVSDRLMFLCKDGFSLSETNEHLNFLRTTVTDVLDSDRIDVKVASDDSAFLQWAKPMAKSMVLLSPTRQFSCDWEGALTPRTASLTQATAYPTSPDCEPVSAGPNLYFASEAGNHAALMEMFIQKDTVTTDAGNVSSHAPRFVPRNVRLAAAHNTFDIVLLVSEETPNTVYVYKHHWQGDEKVQSAWSRWIFDGIHIVNMKVVDEYLYLCYFHGNQTYIGRLNLKLSDPGLAAEHFSHPVHLDFLQKLTGSFNSVENRTYFTTVHPLFSLDNIETTQMVLVDGRVITNTTPTKFFRLSDHQCYMTGSHIQNPVYFGRRYNQSFTLSEQFAVNDQRSVLTARLQLRNMTISFANTGFFKTTVTMRGMNPATGSVVPVAELVSSYTSRTLGDNHFHLNAPQLTTDTYRFPVLGQSKDVKITISNDTYLPANFQAAEWEGLVVTRTR